MRCFNIITIFPNIINSYCSETILNRAQKNNLIKINAINLRDFTEDKHQKVDDTPYGGGPGMVMKPEPIYEALKSLNALAKKSGLDKVIEVIELISKFKFQPSSRAQVEGSSKRKRTILLSPRGKQFDQRMAERLSKLDEITFVCGRYEGVDQRVVDYMVDEEISIGSYVLAGGELGALVIVEAVSRLIPEVLGNEESLKVETFNESSKFKVQSSKVSDEIESSKEYAQYTKPADFRGWKVPDVLLSGDHGKIAEWRKNSK